MNAGKLTRLPPVEIGFRSDPERPVIPLAMQVRDAGCAAPHAHPRGQLIYASSGVMRVICGRDLWVVPPSQAVWVPPWTEHEVYFPGAVALRNLFVAPTFAADLPRQCTVIRVSSLLRELILRAMEIGDAYPAQGPDLRLMLVLLDELGRAQPTPLHLPMARDARVLRVMETLLENPGDGRSLGAWSETAGASARTLARLFIRETGLTFGAWRKRLLLQEAVARLDRGTPVTRVAYDLGYRSLSAFIEMFRQALGSPPGRYARSGQQEHGQTAP